jgi:protein ImuB
MFAGELTDIQKENSDSLLATLNRWGIRNLRALAALPEVALSERLGQEGLRLQQLARGTASRTLVPLEPPLLFEEAIELEHPIVLLEPLAFLLNRLLEQLCNRLAIRALAAQELRLTLKLDHRARISNESGDLIGGQKSSAENDLQLSPTRPNEFCRRLTLPLPMLDAKLFLKLLQLDLSAHPPGAPIVQIHLAAEPSRPRSAQGGLFLPPSPEPEKLELTLARIAGIVGENKVGSVELLDTYRPEGFRMQRFVAAPEKHKSAGTVKGIHDSEVITHNLPSPTEAKSAITALRLFRPPLRANVTLNQGQPAHVMCSRKKEVQGNVLWKAGPWRFSGDWWERETWARDEWDIALQNKNEVALYRLVCDLLGGSWFVEGTYD